MCHIKTSFWDEKEAKRLFQELPFCVLIEKPGIKHVNNIDLLHERPFYDELSIVKISQAFKRYARSYKVEVIDSKDPLAQLEASKSSTEDLFKALLNEIRLQISDNSKCFAKQTQRKWRHGIYSCLF